MRKLLLPLLAAVALVLSGCSLFHPYRIQIQQGTKLSAAKIKQLKPGMRQDQVRYILGSPNVKDPFHPNRWEYVYTNEENYLPRAEHKLSLDFANGRLTTISGDYTPPKKIAKH